MVFPGVPRRLDDPLDVRDDHDHVHSEPEEIALMICLLVLFLSTVALLVHNWVASGGIGPGCYSPCTLGYGGAGTLAGIGITYICPKQVGKWTALPTLIMVAMTLLCALSTAGVTSFRIPLTTLWFIQGTLLFALPGAYVGYRCGKPSNE